MLYVQNRAGETLAVIGKYYKDTRRSILENGASTYQFTISKNEPDEEFVIRGNYIIMLDSQGRGHQYTIIRTEENHDEKEVYCEDASLELLNKERRAWAKPDTAQPISYYANKALADTGWQIGLNEIPNLKRTLEWTGRDTAFKRLLSIANAFDVELDFYVDFNMTNVVRRVVDIKKMVGSIRDDIQLVYGESVTDIKKTESIESMVTALEGIGSVVDGTPEGQPEKHYNFSEIAYDDGDYFSPKGDPMLYARTANQEFNIRQGYIERGFEYDTKDPQELLNRAISELKKVSQPMVNYEVSLVKYGITNLHKGDTIKIIDSKFSKKAQLLLQTRVLDISETETGTGDSKAVFGNFLTLQSNLSKEIMDLQQKLRQLPKARTPYPWVRYADDDKGTGMSTLPAGKAYMATVWSYETAVPSDNPIDYAGKWVKVKGEDGQDGSNGIEGPKGEDGRTSYFHTAWANDISGTTGFTTSGGDGKKYIGTYSDFTKEDSEESSKYNWALFKGEDGQDGQDGQPGKDGTGIKTTVVRYQASSSGTTHPTGIWSSTVPAVTKGQYLWTRTDWTYTDNSTETGYSVSYIAKDGNDGTNGIAGKDGVGIKTTTITYASSTSGTTPPVANLVREEGWTAGNGGVLFPVKHDFYKGTHTLYYLKNAKESQVYAYPKDMIKLTPNTKYTLKFIGFASSNVRDIQVWILGTSSDGKTRQNVLAVDNRKLSPSEAEVVTATFTTGDVTTSGQLRFDNNGSSNAPTEAGLYFAEVQIVEGTTAGPYEVVSPTDSTWSSTPPAASAGHYIWTKTVWAYTDGTSETGYSVGKIGDVGPKGDTGDRGLQGLQGPQGTKGIEGPKGLDGKSSYTHIAYATSSTGDGFSQTPTATTTHVGMYVDQTATDSTDPSKYKWTLIKGADGGQGTPGKAGTDGKTPYLHTAYSWSADGIDRFMTSYPNESLLTETFGPFVMGYGIPNTTWDTTNQVSGISLPLTAINVEVLPQNAGFPYTWMPGVTYTQSIYISTDAPLTGTPISFTWFTDAYGHDTRGLDNLVKVSTNVYRAISTYTWPSSNSPAAGRYRNIDLYNLTEVFDFTKGTFLKFYKPKLELGTTATTSTPSPLDDPEGAYPKFIGTYTDYTAVDSTDPSKYTWAKIRGEQGERGKQIFKSNYENIPNRSGHWWSNLSPAPSVANPPKIGDTVITPSGNILQIDTVIVDGGGGGGTFGVGDVLGNIKGPQGPKGDPGSKDVPVLTSGTSFPAGPKNGDQHWKTNSTGDVIGFYKFNGSSWVANNVDAKALTVTSLSALTANLGTINTGTLNGTTINSPNINSPYSHAIIDGGGEFAIKSTGSLTFKDGKFVLKGNVENDSGVPNGQTYYTEISPAGFTSYITDFDGTSIVNKANLRFGVLDLFDENTSGSLSPQSTYSNQIETAQFLGGWYAWNDTGNITVIRDGRIVTVSGYPKHNGGDMGQIFQLPDWATPAYGRVNMSCVTYNSGVGNPQPAMIFITKSGLATIKGGQSGGYAVIGGSFLGADIVK